MESNLVQPWDRIESRKNTLNERPKRSKFLSTANLSSTTLRQNYMVTWPKRAPKQRRRPGQATKTGYSYRYQTVEVYKPISLKVSCFQLIFPVLLLVSRPHSGTGWTASCIAYVRWPPSLPGTESLSLKGLILSRWVRKKKDLKFIIL